MTTIAKIQRNADLITGNEDLEHLFTIPNFPVFMGQTEQDSSLDLTCDWGFYISRGSGMVQLNPLVPLDILYHTSHSSGKVGKLWANHHKQLADFISKYNPKKVFEIGGGHGFLSQHVIQSNNTDWTIIDPNSESISGVNVINGFFDYDTVVPNDVDMFVHSHVLEHIYDPSAFFKLLSTLNNGTRMCFSVPRLHHFVKNKHPNALNFEHTYLCTEEYIEWWLGQSGFALLEKQYYVDHSVFYATEKTDNVEPLPMPALYSEHKVMFDEFFSYYQTLVERLNNKIDQTTGVYLFGGHIFSQFLLAMGLHDNKIKGILDNDSTKHGKRLYGTRFIIESPVCLSSIRNEYAPKVIVKTGIYDQEIKEGLLKINPNIVFVD